MQIDFPARLLYHIYYTFYERLQLMKKPLLILSALLMSVCIFLPARALAEEEMVLLTVGTTDGEAGAEVDVPVLLSDCECVDSAQFDINYDASALSVVSVTPGDLFPAEYCIANTDESGRIRVACACASGLANDGTLMTIRFKILTETGSALTLTSGIITRIDEAYVQSEAYVTLENGGVTVGGAAVPEPLVTPWVPATPVPTPSPTPEVTEAPGTMVVPDAGQSSAAPEAAESTQQSVGPIAYAVVGALALLLIVLIVVSVRNKRRASPSGRNGANDKRKEE